MSDSLVHSTAAMGTVVTIHIVGHGDSPAQRADRQAAVERAVEWFRVIETCCTTFDDASELRQLCARVGEPVVVSELLFQAVSFAVRVAEDTDGAFDPTIGEALVARGGGAWAAAAGRSFASLRTGAIGGVATGAAAPAHAAPPASYKDVLMDEARRTIELRRPLMLDLGAVAKGLAVDAAARELQSFRNFVVDAGGDLYCGGNNVAGEAWSIGVRNPRNPSELIDTVSISDSAVCTSGDYDPKSRTADGGHHILDPRSGSTRTGRGPGRPPSAATSTHESRRTLAAGGRPDPAPSATALASVTVIAPSAMVADALSTAAFVLGPRDGIAMLERHGVSGIMFTPTLERFETRA